MALPLEKLQAVQTIISHANCADGTAAAMFLHDVLPAAKVIFLQYGTEAYRNLKAEPGMLFCDFSPHPETYQQFIDAGALILDHHKTARGVVEAFGENGVFGDEETEPGVAGATLAYRHVWSPLRGQCTQASFANDFARLAGIRDTWQNQSPEWLAACAQGELLRFMGTERLLSVPFMKLSESWDRDFKWIGEVLLEQNVRSVRAVIKGAVRFTSDKGTRVVMFDSTKLSSDAAEALGSEADLVIGFGYVQDDVTTQPKMIVSTRSHTIFDCAAFALRFGGGGHTKAAGFSVAIYQSSMNPYEIVRGLLESYELGGL
jgi:oligoribonuclease NrnB/cAMP/cGMP phosphodiesterase (DHH superfamily)